MDNDAHLQFMNEIDNFASRFQQQKKIFLKLLKTWTY